MCMLVISMPVLPCLFPYTPPPHPHPPPPTHPPPVLKNLSFLIACAKLYCIFVVTHVHMVKNKYFGYFIQCQNCQVKHHLTCINIKKDEIISDIWYCPACVQGIFASNHFDDHDIYCAILEGASDCAFHLQEVDIKVFIPFEINDSLDISFGDIEPDMQYHWYELCWKYEMWLLFWRYI